MRPIERLVHGRTRVTPRWALMPLEGFPPSKLPTFPGCDVYVLASPRLGAEFVQMIIDMPPKSRGSFPASESIETFWYLLSSDLDGGERVGSFGLVPPGEPWEVSAFDRKRYLVLRKRYEPAEGFERAVAHRGWIGDVPKQVWAGDDGALLQTLLPDDRRFDLAMNVFTFSPGHGLPIIETHVMEHGALILQGKGLYYLGDEWMEVEKDDFIWMGPFCPQSFYATGPTPASYLYYKNVHRNIPL